MDNIDLTQCGIEIPNMASSNLVNNGSGTGLAPIGAKPLPEPMLIYC